MRQHRPNNGYSSNPNSKHDDNSELRLKNRGYYQQMYDKYSTAARESLSLGERIEAECHFQHAEHYLRQLNDRIRYDNEAQQQQQQRYQAQQAQQAQRNNRKVDENPVSESSEAVIEGETPVVNNDIKAEEALDVNASAPEKRPYRKRVLRTPHRRHTPNDHSQTDQTGDMPTA
jgi:hypothetical protein